MTITNSESGTNIAEVAQGIWRINTPVGMDGDVGFSFNQYLVEADRPLLFHTGPRQIFPLVRDAVAQMSNLDFMVEPPLALPMERPL